MYGEVATTQFTQPPKSSLIQKAKDFSTGLVKGAIESSVGTARFLQGTGQRAIAAIDPTKDLEEVREETGFRSLSGEEAKEIDELLKAENTAEKAGKISAFVAELLLPTGSRKVVGKGIEKGVELVEGTIGKAEEVVSPLVKTAKNVATGVKDVTEAGVESLGRIPARVATNVADSKATRATIQNLPTKIARDAVQDGADLQDIQYLYKLPKEEKAPLRTLLKVVQDFEKGVTKTNPIEVVGKPIVNRIQQLESARGTIGQKLGEVANDLGEVTTKEVFPSVFESLKRVSGLNGLKVSKNGILDFTDTVLTTAETKADRKAIQSIFMSAIKKGTGKQKHLLRQELFETLGGKKKALSNLTDTQEKAYEAVRKGLSDVLEGKNSLYKSLSNEYRKVMQPLQDMRKLMKNVAGADEDILNMDAGLLARRLTSFSKSNPQIRNILRAMDEATKVKGKTQLSVENLQDFYNVLDRYYDIAGKTGFQGQVTAGVEKVSGVMDFITKAVGKVSGKSEAVRRKAIESALEEALK